MLKRFICLFLILVFSSTTLFAQTAAQVSQIKQGLASPQGQKFLESAEGKKLIEKYGDKVAQVGDEMGQPVDVIADKDKDKDKDKRALSDLELALSAGLLLEGKEPLRQYGYDIFKSTVASFTPGQDVPVGPDYIIGPGDSFNVTLWGITEGIFKVEVNPEGSIILPKVGVVAVTGLSYGELKPYIEQQLRRYYESVNVGITIDQLRSIRVYVVGEVARPGSYTVSSLSTAYTALFSAGGPTKKGTLRSIQVIRNGRIIARVDLYKFLLKGDKSQDIGLQSGDTVFVPLIGEVAGIAGAVNRPAIYEINGKTDLADLVYLAGGFLPSSYLNRVQVTRIEAHEKVVVKDENISSKRAAKQIGFSVQNMDLVEVFPIYESINDVLYVEGAVKYPGKVEYQPGLRIKDVLPNVSVFIGGAYLPNVEVVRIDPKTLKISILTVDCQKLFSGDEAQNILLKPQDKIVVSAEKKREAKIVLSGELNRPGEYTIAPGERLSSVLMRAGGFTPDAYLFGARFTRKSAKEMQVQHTQKLASNLQEQILTKTREIASGAVGENERMLAETQLANSQKLLDLIREKMPAGRVIIDLKYPVEAFIGTRGDIELEAGDELSVSPISNVVSAIGEVYNPSSVVYVPDKDAGDYLDQVGGITRNADKDSIYIIRADGSVVSREQGKNVMATRLVPGDVIIVPQIIERVNMWAHVKDWTHWFYEAALAFAVIANYLNN